MTQWKDEIEKKADGRLRVLIHHGKGKAGQSKSDSFHYSPPFLLTCCCGNTEARKLQKYDVVITSYPTCAGEWPDGKKRAGKKSAAADDSDDDEEEAEELAKQAGPLFDPDYMFYRSECWSSGRQQSRG